MSVLPQHLHGRWSVERAINGGAGTFTGTAEFTDHPDGGLAWREHGRLRLEGHDGPAARTLRIVDDEVRFDDGRPFHALVARPIHRCGADVYSGEIEVLDADRFRVVWRIRGPRKDDVIETTYVRAP